MAVEIQTGGKTAAEVEADIRTALDSKAATPPASAAAGAAPDPAPPAQPPVQKAEPAPASAEPAKPEPAAERSPESEPGDGAPALEAPKPATEPEPRRNAGIDRRIGNLQKRITELQNQLQQAVKPPEQAPEPPKPPARDQYASDDDYLTAMVDYRLSLKTPEIRQELERGVEQTRAEERAKAVRDSFMSQIPQVREKYADYDEVMSEEHLSEGLVSPIMQAYIERNGPEFTYHLFKDLEVANAIARMDPIDAAEKLVELKRGIAAPKPLPASPPVPAKPAAAPVSKAPAPIAPVSGKEQVTSPNPISATSFDSYETARLKQLEAVEEKRKSGWY